MSTINISLQKKTAARMVAVQSLYQVAMLGDKLSAEEQVKRLKAQLKNNQAEQKLLTGSAIEPDYALLGKLLSGVAEWEKDIEKRLDEVLSAKWKKERTSKLIIAILECAIFELFFYKDVKHKVIIDEYTRLARGFFADSEVDFVFAALSSLVQKYAAG
ncbi:MAG: hypothetical protein EBR02_07525 [Alphaproteobacteria bacterium]|nr:hypothetical protein [Alphaproteobacteria bacterium]